MARFFCLNTLLATPLTLAFSIEKEPYLIVCTGGVESVIRKVARKDTKMTSLCL